MSRGSIVVSNALWLMLATAAQKVISFLTFLCIARWTGVNITGEYFFVVSISSMFAIVADFGLTPVVIRELAADPVGGWSAFVRARRLKMVLIPAALFLILGYSIIKDVSSESWLPILLAGGVMSLDALSLLFYGVLRGLQQLRFEAVGMFVTQVITAIVSLVCARMGYGAPGLVAGLLAGSAWNMGWSWFQICRHKPDNVRTLPHGSWMSFTSAAIPFGLAGLFVKIYSYIDTVLLQDFHGRAVVGQYGVAYKTTYAFQFIPMTIGAALYPAMSAAFAQRDEDGLRDTLLNAFRLMLILSIPLTVGLSVFADVLIPFLYGNAYHSAASTLTVLVWVMIPLFLDFPLGSLLNATGRAHQKTLAMGYTMVISVVLNLIFVPSFKEMGAAIAACMSFWCLFFFGVWYTRRELFATRTAFVLFLYGVIGAILAWIFGRWLLEHVSWMVALGGTIFFLIFWMSVTRLIRFSDVKRILVLLRVKNDSVVF